MNPSNESKYSVYISSFKVKDNVEKIVAAKKVLWINESMDSKSFILQESKRFGALSITADSVLP